MKNQAIRWVVILAALSIAGITITQIYWVTRAFNLKEAEFNREVTSALVQVSAKIFEMNHLPAPEVNPVEQISTNYFVVSLDGDASLASLGPLLKAEFSKRKLNTDFEYGIYDCSNRCMVYGDYVSMGSAEIKPVNTSWPAWSQDTNHFGIRLVNRESHLLNQMGIWLFSTAVMVVVILFFAYTIFVILRQKRLSEIQRSFINNITHEFKTPMSTIAVAAEVLKDPGFLQQPGRLLTYATLIEKETNHLRSHVDKVMQLARLEKDEILLHKERFSLEEVIRESILRFELQVQERQGEIRFEPEVADAMVYGDKLHLANVFNNLIDNAIKYSQDSPRIEIRLSRNGSKSGNLVVEVSDQGIGIPLAEQKKIFRKFYRVSTGNVHDVKGFGIGLNYVKTILKYHKGQVKVHSAGPGTGTRFTIVLPGNTHE